MLSTEFEGAKVALNVTKRRFAGVLRRFGVQVDEPLPAVVEDKDALKDVGVLCRVGIQVDESIPASAKEKDEEDKGEENTLVDEKRRKKNL